MHWNTIPIHVIDFEGSRETGVLEYGIVTLQQGQIQCAHTQLCLPKSAIPDRDTQQHGLKESALKNAEPFENKWDLFNQIRKTGIFCAHSANVEHRFLKNTWPHPSSVPAWPEGNQTTNHWGPWIDTLELYRRIYPGLASYKLMDLVQTFSLEADLNQLAEQHCPKIRKRPHCALFDALASAKLLLQLAHTPGFEMLTAAWLIEYSAASSEAQESTRQQELKL